MAEKYPLSASMTDFVKQSQSFFPDAVVNQGIDAQRVAYHKMTSHFASPRPESLVVEDKAIDGVPVRHYSAKQAGQKPADKDHAIKLQILFAHGGGWYLGGLDSHDSFCAHLAHDCGIELIAIDYALAPESPYPEGLNDVERVYQSLSANSACPILLMGDSAGGNLMAALSLRCRRKNSAPAYAQCLIYPALSQIGSLPSHQSMSDAPLLEESSLSFCWDLYVSPQSSFKPDHSNDKPDNSTHKKTVEDASNEELVPLNASSHASLPATMIFAAQYDPLIDDARYYQQALQASNVSVELSVIRGLVHGGLHGFNTTEEGRKLYMEIRDYVQSLVISHKDL